MASNCPHCGIEAPPEARFCMKCGREVGEAKGPSAGAPSPGAAPATPPMPGLIPPPSHAPVVPSRPAPLPPPRHAPVAPPAGPPGQGQFPAAGQPAAGPFPVRSGPPSPLGAFFGRAFRGEWAGPCQAALWPVALLLVAAVGLAIPRYGQPPDEVVVEFGDRLRIALALLLKSIGGGFAVHAGDSTDLGAAGIDGGSTFSLIPLTVTVLWLAALYVGLRRLRTRMAVRTGAVLHGPTSGAGFPGRVPGQQGPGSAGAWAATGRWPGGPAAATGASATAGLEAAVRVSVVVTAAVLVLALIAQPTVMGIDISSSPVLSALGALLLSLAVASAVLHRDEAARWLSSRPGARMLLRALGTALRALAIVLVLSSIAAFIALTRIDDLDEALNFKVSGVSPLVLALLVLPNLGAAALGLGWGAPLEATAGGSSSYGGGYESHKFGLFELADAAGSGAVVGALAVGLVCALVVGVLAARRSAGRAEQLLAAGIFFGFFLLLAAVGGFGIEAQGAATAVDAGGNGSVEAGLNVPDVLLFGLLWVFGAAFVAPYLRLRLRTGAGPGAGAGTAAPAAGAGDGLAGYPALPGPAAPHDAWSPTSDAWPVLAGGPAPLDPSAPHARPVPHRSPAVIWVATLAAAFLIGGGATAGVLLWQDHTKDADSPGKGQSAPTAGTSRPPATPNQPPDQTPPQSSDPTQGPGSSGPPADASAVPTGYQRVTDDKGFSFAVPDGWTRQGVTNGSQITYAGATGLEHFLVGVIPNAGYTSYDNFTTMEKRARKKDGYQRITLEHATFQNRAGALWEYTYTDEAGQTIHCKDQGYVAADGTEYAIQLASHDDDWQSGLSDTFDEALASWRLTDGS